MSEAGWGIWSDRGLLMSPDPYRDIPDMPDDIQDAARAIADWIANGDIRARLTALPIVEVPLNGDVPILEAWYRVYAFLATAYVHTPNLPAADHLPASIAVPLSRVAARIDRPPILTYSGFTLNNWQRRDPSGDFSVKNLDTILHFTHFPDETWFTLIHVAVEAQAACALEGMCRAVAAVHVDDAATVESNLAAIARGLTGMTETFRRMPEGCSPDIYFDHVRPFFFGFNGVVFQGADDPSPRTLRGGTGAQSSVVPALGTGLGIAHVQNALTAHLIDMRQYMPKPHQDFIDRMKSSPIRDYVLANRDQALCDAYDAALLALLEFRRTHFGFARVYIFNKSPQAYGTGGTDFMDWLRRLADETEAHLIAPKVVSPC